MGVWEGFFLPYTHTPTPPAMYLLEKMSCTMVFGLKELKHMNTITPKHFQRNLIMKAPTTIVLVVLLGGALLALAQNNTPAASMEEAAQAFLDLLDDDAHARAYMAFDSDERFNWHFVPRRRQGLPLKAMTARQQEAAHALLQSALSQRGYEKTTSVIELEGVLGGLESNPTRRDAENYYVTIFGTPSKATPWGWRFEGHHLSLNYTSVTDELLAATPAFFGANPAEVPRGDRKGWRVLAIEEDRARTLLALLDEAQRDRAMIASTAPRDIITGADRHARLERFEGLPASAMTPAQRDTLLRLVEAYIHTMRPDIAAAQWTKMEEAGIGELHFAWAGSTRRGEGHYYRIHGPTLLIEYDNTQNDANHVHSVWRGFDNDFGEDLLRKHYQESDHH